MFIGIDMCSGPGGLSEGFMSVKYRNYKFHIAVANDVDIRVRKTYMANHPNTKFVLGSIANESTKKPYKKH